MAGSQSSYEQVAAELRRARRAVVCAHVDPDGDAIGSVLGMTAVLRRLGADVVPVLSDAAEAPPTYAFLEGFADFRHANEVEPRDVLIALDTPSKARLGGGALLAGDAARCVVMDHHPDNSLFGDLNLVDADSAATGQMIWRLLPALGVEPDAELARCLYVALLTDTGRFQYGNVDAAVLRDAADMVDRGVDVHETYVRVYENQSLGQMEMVGRVKERVTVVNGGRVAYSWVDEGDYADTGAVRQATENLVDAIRVLGGVDVVFLVKAVDGECRVSLRAKGEADVGAVARILGGGGHRAAAGFSFAGDMPALLETLLPRLPHGEE